MAVVEGAWGGAAAATSKEAVSDREEEASYRTNQVVWAKKDGSELWFPGVIIDAEFFKSHAEEGSAAATQENEAHERVFWLGYSSVQLVPKAKVRDFCVGFQHCYRTATEDQRTLESVKVAVQLAAVRAQESMEDPASEWLQWGLANLHKFEELILSDTFYQSLGRPRDVASAGTASAKGGLGGFRQGSIVWVREAGVAWPAIVVLLKPDTEKVDVVMVAGSQLRRKSGVAVGEVRPFCEHLEEELEELGAVEGPARPKDAPERLASMKRVVAVVSNQSEEQMEEDWEAWAKSNVRRYKDFVLSADDVKDILKNTSRTGEQGRKAKGPEAARREADAAKRARKDAAAAADATEELPDLPPISDFYVGASDEKTPAGPPKAKRQSFGVRRKGGEFSDDERAKLSKPLDQGWTRILAKRRPGNKKFGDIYYGPPVGKRLRSMKEVNDYLAQFPQHAEGLATDNFCFTDVPLRHDNEQITEPKS